MVNFLNLETAKTPDMKVDWNGATAPLRNALSGYREGMNDQYDETQRKEQQTYQRGRDAKSDHAESKALWGKRALAFEQTFKPDDPRRGPAWSRLVQGLGSKDMTPEEMDHMSGPKLMAIQAGVYNDPRDSQMKDLEIQYKQSEINKNNLREDKSKVMDVNGRLVRVPQSGPAEEIYSSPNAGAGKEPSGFEWNPQKPGALRPIAGGPGEFRNFTEGQTKDAGFGARMLRAEDNIDSVMGYDSQTGSAKGYDPTRKSNAYFPDQSRLSNLYTANMVNSKEWQQYIQGSRESMAALLRKDTGAAVTDQEFDLYFPMYYPQPGDSAEVVKQKKAGRVEIARGLAASSGGAFEKAYPERASILREGRAGDQQRGGPPGKLARPQSQQDYESMPPGTRYLDPTGRTRTKQ
jgi:hypothetical protein